MSKARLTSMGSQDFIPDRELELQAVPDRSSPDPWNGCFASAEP